MLVFNGKEEAETILMDIKEKISAKKITPTLAIILVGNDPSSRLFIKNKKKAAERIGIAIQQHSFETTVKEDEVIAKIDELNRNNGINGIIVQLPLPKSFNTDKIIEKIDSKKDVDGFHKKTRFSSPLISAILLALKTALKDFQGKKILVVVNSEIFGKTLQSFFKKEGIKISFILKKKHYFLDLRTKLKSADTVITACGCLRQLKGDMIKEGAVLIDAGITLLSNGKVVGDIDKKSVEKKAAFLTPVPGGIGPLTVAYLLKNVYGATRNH